MGNDNKRAALREDFQDAHSAAKKDLKDFMLLKNLSGKLHWLSLLAFTIGIIIATGNFSVLLFSACLGVIVTFGYYLTRLDAYLKIETARRQAADQNDASGVEPTTPRRSSDH